MFDGITEIFKDRSCGYLRICFVKQWSGTGISDITKRMGLNSDPVTYQPISRDDALSVIAWILHKDLAYSTELISIDIANKRAFALIDSLPASSTFYFNGHGPDSIVGKELGWNPATDATMDSGIIAFCGEFGFGLWVEDED